MSLEDGFVVDGEERLHDALRTKVAEVVEAEFAPRLAEANWLKCFRIRQELRLEVERRLSSGDFSDMDVESPPVSEHTLW